MMIKPERVAKAVYIHELEADAINPVPFGGEDQLRQGSIKRLEIRDILGTKMMREVTLK